MTSKGREDYTLDPGQEVTVEDRWDPLAYAPYFEVTGRVEFKHTVEVPPWFIRNTVGTGRHQIGLPPGYNKLVFRGLDGRSFVSYRVE